jgi:hypothetical protein
MAPNHQRGLGSTLVPLASDAVQGLTDTKAIRVLPERFVRVTALPKFCRDSLFAPKLDHVVEPYLADPEVNRSLKALRWLRGRPGILRLHTAARPASAIQIAGLGCRPAFYLQLSPSGRYPQILLGPLSGLAVFAPEFALICFGAQHARVQLPLPTSAHDVKSVGGPKVEGLVGLWGRANGRFDSTVIPQALLNTARALLGCSEATVPAGSSTRIGQVNVVLRRAAGAKGILLPNLDQHAAPYRRQHWFDPSRWHVAREPVSPHLSPLYGDPAPGAISASQDLSGTHLVLALDDTLWGWIIGDHGLGNIPPGRGGGTGEAFLASRAGCKIPRRRRIILAVCSRTNAQGPLAALTSHLERLLHRSDGDAFVANWAKKPPTIRQIAATLEIGRDSPGFVDSPPSERPVVRPELPMVAGPGFPCDMVPCAERIADAGYLEAVAFAGEGANRIAKRGANPAPCFADATATDLPGFLGNLETIPTGRPTSPRDLFCVTRPVSKEDQPSLTARLPAAMERPPSRLSRPMLQ